MSMHMKTQNQIRQASVKVKEEKESDSDLNTETRKEILKKKRKRRSTIRKSRGQISSEGIGLQKILQYNDKVEKDISKQKVNTEFQ